VDYEKLGAFYLGRSQDPASGAPGDLLLYDAKDLTTHGVIVGMTGSGKTGLGIALLEEAAIDGIPAIVIDPKGDLGNLLLTFPDLRPDDFQPWVDPAEAQRKGLSVPDMAAKTAESWRKGLAEWHQEPARIQRFRDAVEMAIYTPGSTAGRPLSVLKGFAAPPQAVLDDPDGLRERVLASVSGLLALLGIDADPVRSREHILLSTLLSHAWSNGQSPDLAALIRQIQDPPVTQVGVLDIESFYPRKDRFGLAMALNGLVASPGFSAWMQGEPLDVQRLLYTPEGKPRLAILSIAHLSDAERMFFVTLLLGEIVGWMRAQSGTSSLRALLYMDEVFGYFPPSANPPSKMPMLTLLKQARAFGLGVVLATQNPVDLDYKGLGNAGTWFLGRLQTERDKMRVLDGLEGASGAGALSRSKLDTLLSNLKQRTFLMVNAHDDQPTLFQTRWVLSYLRGPLTREQIVKLKGAQPSAAAAASRAAEPASAVRSGASVGGGIATGAAKGARPVVPPGVTEVFRPWRGSSAGGALEYRPGLLATARLHYVEAKSAVDHWESLALLAPVPDELATEPWAASEVLTGTPEVEREPAPGAAFAPLPSAASRPKGYPGWQKAAEDHLYRTRSLSLWRSAGFKLSSKPGESQGDFKARLAQSAREARDLGVEKLRQKYASKVNTLQDRIRTAEDKVARERDQASQASLSRNVSLGAAVLGALFGNKRSRIGSVGRVGTAARGMGRASKEKADVERAEEGVDVLRQRLADLEAEIASEAAQLQADNDAAVTDLEEVRVAPRKSDVTVAGVALAWTPWRVAPDGSAIPAL
jgi:hypothetical protein